ncbi:MAG: hypothetical protein ACRDZN_07145, partial [Acidimicrobiales bacterium]
EQFSDPEAAGDQDAIVDALRSLDPPDEIRDDFELITEAIAAVAEVDPEDTDAIADIQTEFEDRGAVEAGDNVETFIAENCDSGTDDAGTDDTSDTGPEGTGTDEGPPSDE